MPQRALAVLVLTISIFLAGCASQNAARQERRVDELSARDAAERWLALLDNGDYEEAFEWEAQDFRMTRTQKQFVRYMQARRQPFGKALGRKAIGSQPAHKFAGVPEGNYMSVIFKTAFENKHETAERVILVRQTIGWRVIDYRIY
jgi:hypothetical protein